MSLIASLKNQGDVALGNVIGSNIFNVGIILGLTALICPVIVSLQVIKHDGPIMIAVSIIAMIIIAKGFISRLMGTMLLMALGAYTFYTILMSKRGAPSVIEKQFADGIPSRTSSVYRDLTFIGGGLLFLVVGSRLLVESATEIARLVGISEAVIGLTVIAGGTSLPELATSTKLATLLICPAIPSTFPPCSVGILEDSSSQRRVGNRMSSPLAPSGGIKENPPLLSDRSSTT